MPRKNKILLRTGSTTPAAVDFVTSEPAWDSSAGILYVKNAAGTMVSVGPNTASPTFTGTVSIPAGTVTAPGIYFSTFTDTGLYRPATNSVAVTCAGTERMRWTVSGIWVTTPSIVVGTMTSRTAGPATHPVIQLEGTTAGAVSYQAICGSTTATVSPQILLARHRGAVGDSTLVASGDSLGIITWRGGDGTDCVSAAAQIEARVDGTPAANDMPGRLIFSTTAAGAETASERMRITSAGNVGIGTTGPTSPLHVVGTVDCDGLIVGTTTASATGIALLGAADAAAGRTTLSAAAATHTHDAADVASGVLSTARLGTGSANSSTYLRGDGAWSTISGGGIVEAATPASFPATGASATLYLSTDTSRLYRWVDATTKYIEVGPVGGGDTALWSLFLPPAPTSVSGTSGSGQVALSWTAPTVAAQTPITDYVVQYSSNNGSTWLTFSDGTSTTTSATVTGLTNGTAYIFRVAAVNAVGTGTYSAATASITAGSDSLYSSVQILLHCDGTNGSTTFADNSGTPKTITAGGGVTVSTAQSKFGGASAYFNGTTDSLSFADVTLGTGDFTIEMFFKTASSVQYAQLIGNETSSSSTGYTLLINNNSSTGGQIAVYRQGNLVVQSSSGDWSDDAWHHVALVRSGTTVTLWIDGTSYGTATDTNSYSGGTYYIGRNNIYTPRNMIGYIDEIRITKAARYTSAFTPTTVAFSNS